MAGRHCIMADLEHKQEQEQGQDQDQRHAAPSSQTYTGIDIATDIIPLHGASSSSTNIPRSVTASPLDADNWAENLPSTEHVRFFRATNWRQSPLGPLTTWSHALRLHTFTVFSDSRAAVIYW